VQVYPYASTTVQVYPYASTTVQVYPYASTTVQVYPYTSTTVQVYPADKGAVEETKLQTCLRQKLGDGACPFTLKVIAFSKLQFYNRLF
jgi:hypothetical protein